MHLVIDDQESLTKARHFELRFALSLKVKSFNRTYLLLSISFLRSCKIFVLFILFCLQRITKLLYYVSIFSQPCCYQLFMFITFVSFFVLVFVDIVVQLYFSVFLIYLSESYVTYFRLCCNMYRDVLRKHSNFIWLPIVFTKPNLQLIQMDIQQIASLLKQILTIIYLKVVCLGIESNYYFMCRFVGIYGNLVKMNTFGFLKVKNFVGKSWSSYITFFHFNHAISFDAPTFRRWYIQKSCMGNKLPRWVTKCNKCV